MSRQRSLVRSGATFAVAVLAAGLLLAACGDDGGSADDTTTTAEQDQATEPEIDFDVELDDALLEANAAAFAPEEPGATLQMEDVAGSDAGFVAVGYETETDTTLPAAAAAWWSEDGWNWERIADDTFDDPARMDAVVATDDGFVAVGSAGRTGDDAAVWRSDDGRDWERVEGNDDAFAGGDMSDVTGSGDGLVAVGRVRVGGEDETELEPGIWRSSDGDEWERVEDSDLPGMAADVSLNGVTVSDDGFVGGGVRSGEAEVWRSDDGTTWERVESDAFEDGITVGELAASADGYVATGSAGKLGEDATEAIWFSPDGEEWEPVDVDLNPDLSVSGLDANSDGRFVAAGPLFSDPLAENQDATDTSEVWASADGRSWDLLPFEDEVEAQGSILGVGVFANGYIAVGTEEGSAQVWVDPLEVTEGDENTDEKSSDDGESSGDDFTDPDETIDVGVGDTFTISLDSNPTTGYSWQFAEPVDDSVLESLGSEYEPDPGAEDEAGRGGTEHFSFEAVGEGSTTIELEYVPPGGDSGERTTFSVNVG